MVNKASFVCFGAFSEYWGTQVENIIYIFNPQCGVADNNRMAERYAWKRRQRDTINGLRKLRMRTHDMTAFHFQAHQQIIGFCFTFLALEV